MEKVRDICEKYTSIHHVEEILDSLPEDVWEEGKTFMDPECGVGNFLVAVAKRKLKLNHKNILQTLHGSDIFEDNVQNCKSSLLAICGDTVENRNILDTNIVHKDFLEG